MDANFRVNEIFTDEDTYDVIAKCYDILYDEEFEKFLGNPDEFSGKENASNLLKDSNYEISDEVRADIEDIFGVVEFDKENEYGAGYQFYDFEDDDIDDEDDLEFIDNRKRAIVGAGDDYGFDEYDVRESFNLREALNRIDVNTYNKYDLLNLYESCNLSENEKRALANIVYDQDDPRVIYDTLNDRFVGGKEIEMPERVKDGVIHEDESKPIKEDKQGYIGNAQIINKDELPKVGDNFKGGVVTSVKPMGDKNGYKLYKVGVTEKDSLDIYDDEVEVDTARWSFAVKNTESITESVNTSVIRDMDIGEERSFSLNNYYKFENFTKFWVKKTDDDNFEIWMSSEDGKDIANHTKFSTLSNTLYWFRLTTVDGGGDIPTEVNEAFGDSQEGYDFKAINKELRRELPADEIDNYNMDLYVKVSPKSKEILKKYGIHNHPLLSTFIDQITHTRWYDLPFAYVPINDTEVTEGYEFLDGTKVEAYSDYEIAEERAEELGLKMAEYGDYYNSDLSYCYWNKSGNRNDDAQVIVYYKFENGSPRPLTEMERETVMDKYGIDSFDNPALEDDMGTYFDDIQPELEEGYTFSSDPQDLRKEAMRAYKENDDEFFKSLSDEELVILWKTCLITDGNKFGAPYDDEVYDAISDRPNAREIFDRAKGISEDWSHFTYKSGANPYIATNDKEANRIIRKYKDKCKKVKDGYYEIDDTSNEALSESKKPYSIHTVRQVKDFFRQGESLTNVISYLFTCDYEPEEVVDFLVTKIGCKEQLVKNNLVDGFGINVDRPTNITEGRITDKYKGINESATNKVFIVVELPKGGTPKILGVFKDKSKAEEVAHKDSSRWCNIIEKEVQ
jgi:hypothetical protein